jgi:hypothetical protein
MVPMPIPWDWQDGLFVCYWRRPYAHLREPVCRATSVWGPSRPVAERRAITALRDDVDSGIRKRRNAELLSLDEAALGARLLIASPS